MGCAGASDRMRSAAIVMETTAMLTATPRIKSVDLENFATKTPIKQHFFATVT
jgi:hypothetical protein